MAVSLINVSCLIDETAMSPCQFRSGQSIYFTAWVDVIGFVKILNIPENEIDI